MTQRLLTAAIALALSANGFGQNSDPADNATYSPSIPLTYVGTNARIGVSVNDDGDFGGEALGILGFSGVSAFLAEGWVGQGGAGGVMLGYNWVWGARDVQQTIDSPQELFVAKAFVAMDRNSERDRKLTLGIGGEKQDLFFSAYLSRGETDERFVAQRRVSVDDFILGTDRGRPFRQVRTTTTIFDTYEQAYDHGGGVRLGKYYDNNLWRLRGGLDYGSGDFDSSQFTASLGVDKYFENTGHSISLDVAQLSKDGDFVVDDNDTQASLTYRYEFGQSYRPAAWEYAMANPVPENPSTRGVPSSEEVAVQNEAKLDSDAFFDFDKSEVREDTKRELDQIIATLKSAKLASSVTVVGHTCSIGTDAYNLGLSNRRANAVANYLKASGVDAELIIDGKGESEPAFPNDTSENRKKNRRVDINFVTIEEAMEQREMPAEPAGAVEYRKQVIEVPPGWIERALRNPAQHRREVDTYTFTRSREEATLGARTFLNRGPVAVNDTAAIRRNAAATLITVLVNDSDPDGDTLSVTSVTQPMNGAVQNVGNGVIYTPRVGFVGTDTFTYTNSDGQGGSATATVTITVADQPPVARDDTATVARGATVTVSPLANDTDPEGGILRLVSIDQPAQGTAVIDGNTVRYTAPIGFTGPVSFAYRISDDAGNAASARITITVTNQPPVAVADVATTAAGRPVTIAVLANDTDPEGDALTLAGVGTPANGTATISDGRVIYTPRTGFSGMDTFTYTVRDSQGATSTGTVRVTVIANLAPVANPDNAFVLKGQSVIINVLANDTDPEGDALRVTRVFPGAQSQGTITINANQTITYLHRPGSIGTDVFTYEITDASGNTSIGTVTVTVNRIIVL